MPEFDTPPRFSGKTDAAVRKTENLEAKALEIFELMFC
jgi:hypothetical protein